MRIKAGENRVELINGLRGGVGVAEMRHFLEPADFHGAGRLFSYTVLAPGCSVGWHRHEQDFECYYILHGHGTYNDNGEEFVVNPGDFLLCRPSESHALVNDTDANIEYIALILFVKD